MACGACGRRYRSKAPSQAPAVKTAVNKSIETPPPATQQVEVSSYVTPSKLLPKDLPRLPLGGRYTRPPTEQEE
jgi:hypothetical protein